MSIDELTKGYKETEEDRKIIRSRIYRFVIQYGKDEPVKGQILRNPGRIKYFRG